MFYKNLQYKYILFITSLVGLISSFVLTVEKIFLIKNPDYQPSCSLNPIFSCRGIMESWQAELFGFPNPLLGIIGFSLTLCVAVGIFSEAKFGKKFMITMNAGIGLAFIFILWLYYQAFFKIGFACLYCIFVWLSVIPMFFFTTTKNIQEYSTNLKLKDFTLKYNLGMIIVLELVMVLIFFYQFRSFFF